MNAPLSPTVSVDSIVARYGRGEESIVTNHTKLERYARKLEALLGMAPDCVQCPGRPASYDGELCHECATVMYGRSDEHEPVSVSGSSERVL